MTNFVPIFPLGIVVYPGEQLNLHIYEPRYKQLINECHKEKKLFGIPSIIDDRLQDFGTLARITEITNTTPDGEMDIRTEGDKVFRILEVIKVQDVAYELGDRSYNQGNHSVDMLMAYLPKEKILFNADLYSPPAQGAAPAAPTPGMRTLQQNIRKLKLDVAQHAPAHGRVGTNEEFMKLVAPASTARAN